MANKNAFGVVLPTNPDDFKFYKRCLVNLITSDKYSKLTIAGLDSPEVKRGIDYATPGSIITFGSARNHDVNWIERETYACERGLSPVFVDLHTEWSRVVGALDKYYNEKYPREVSLYISDGRKVKINDGFIQVGYDVVSYATFKSPAYKVVDTFTAADLRAIVAALV